MATRALAYFTRREHCWINSKFSVGTGVNNDVTMLDVTVKPEPVSGFMARLTGGSLSAHGAILEDMLIWLTLFRYTFLLFTPPMMRHKHIIEFLTTGISSLALAA